MTDNEDLDVGIKFNPDVAAEASATEDYAEGWVRAKITDPKRTRSKPKAGDVDPRYYMIQYRTIPLADPEDPESEVGRGVNNYLCLPFEPDYWEDAYGEMTLEDAVCEQKKLRKGSTVYDMLKRNLQFFLRNTHELLSACFPEEVPGLPEFENGTMTFMGEPVDYEPYQSQPSPGKAAYAACKAQAFACAYDKLKEIWENNDVEQLADNVIYQKLVRDDQNRLNGSKICLEHPVNRDGVPEELLEGEAILERFVPEIAATSTKKKTKKKGSKKAA